MTTLRKPPWWQLYALVPLLGGLFMLEHRAALPAGWHTGVEAATILVVCSLVWRWLQANACALMTGPTLYHRHDYNGCDMDGAARTIKVDETLRWSDPRFSPRQVAGQLVQPLHSQRCVRPSSTGNESGHALPTEARDGPAGARRRAMSLVRASSTSS